MGKRAFMATVIITAFLVSLVVRVQVAEVAKANFFVPEYNTQITIDCPKETVYRTPTINLNFTLKSNGFGWYWYRVDVGELVEINVTTISKELLPGWTDTYYRYTRIGNAVLENLTTGTHTVTVVELSSAKEITTAAIVFFSIDPNYPLESPHPTSTETVTITATPSLAPTPSPSPTPASTIVLTASLSESASALNFGNRVNFTVSVEGGNAPFTYAWFIDGELVENGTSPYYATDSQAVGSHHVYVEVKDADNNTAKTLSPEFNVLPSLTYNPSSSISPTQQPTSKPSQTPDRLQVGDFAPVIIPGSMILLGIVAVGLLVYFRKRRG